jgi:hypothetical protein
MRTALLAASLVVLNLPAADTPISAILIEGEGWQRVGTFDHTIGKGAYYVTERTPVGRSVVVTFGPKERGGGRRVAEAAPDEVFGDVARTPDGSTLVVAVPSHHYLYTFQVQPDKSLTAKEKTYALRLERGGKGGSDVGSIAFDTKGRLFVAMPRGVQFFDEEMRFSGQLSRPERKPVTHVGFAGKDLDELWIVCGEDVWKRKVRAKGDMPYSLGVKRSSADGP